MTQGKVVTSMLSLGSGWNKAQYCKIIEIFHFEIFVLWLLVMILMLCQRVHWYVVTSGKVVSNLFSAGITCIKLWLIVKLWLTCFL